MSTNISIIILTYNEEQHLTRCINSVKEFANEIIVVDSYSTDRTIEMAQQLGAKTYQNKFVNQAIQFNWALENCNIQTEWIWRIDADEYVDEELVKNIQKAIKESNEDITGIYVKRKIVFMGRALLHGTWYPRWYLKIFRRGIGVCENRWMDEHIKLSRGKTIQVQGNQIDDNLNDLIWWTQKHNSYSTREMVDMLNIELGLGEMSNVQPKFFGTDEQRLRWLKIKYSKFPFFVRPFINFIYRYFFRFGFLDGKQGFIWHFLQGFWYRFLVDAKIFELKRKFNFDKEKIKQYLLENYKL